MLTTAASTPIADWYLTRATGVVTLVLLTLTVALGVANVKRLQSRRIPRFVIDGVHRNASMLAVVFLALHVITTLFDSYIPIQVTNVIVPFGAGYRPFWVGLGAVSLDLLVAVMVTSLLRRRIGHRTWRATHWLAYASWPVALAHSLGTGTDAGTPWMLALTVICAAIVAAAVLLRLRQEPEAPTPQLRRHEIAPNVRRGARPHPAGRPQRPSRPQSSAGLAPAGRRR